MAKQTCLLCLVLLLSLCLPLAARELAIGTHGATITLDESWQRHTLTPDIGPDQFIQEDGLFAVAFENLALLERRADYELEFEIFLSNIKARFQDLELDPVMQYQRNGRIGHGTRRFQAKIQGIHLAYQLDLVSRDGLGYLLMTWTAASQAARLHEIASTLASSIAFPDPESDWGKAAEPTPHTFRFGDWRIELSYRESVFPEQEDQEQSVTLSSTEDTVAIHLFLDELDDVDLESALDDVVRLLSEERDYEELERVDLELEAGIGRQALLRHRGEQGNFDLAVVMVQVAESTYVDLRLVSMGEAGHRDRLWATMLESLRVKPPAQVDAFPVVEPAAGIETGSLNRAARELLTSAAPFDTGEAFVHSAVSAADGSVIVLDSQRVLRVTEAAEPSVLFSSEDWLSSQQLVVAGEDILLVASDGQVSKIVGRELQPVDFKARYAAAAGASLLLVRTGQAPQMLGFERLVNPHPSRLIERSASGEERIMTELGELTLTAMVTSPDGSTALLAGRDRHLLEEVHVDREVKLLEIDLATAARRQLGAWSHVRTLAGADEGWLVSGVPKDGLMGLYLVDSDGEHELLISGTISGVRLEDDELTFSAGVCLRGEGESPGTCLYRAAMKRVRELGPASWPLTADTMNRIAEEIRRDGTKELSTVTTQAELSGLVAAANTVCERLTSIPLPSSSAAVDQLLADLMGNESLTDDAMTLLAVVMTDSLLREGAEWIDSPASTPARTAGIGVVAENHFALAAHPIQVVISTLYQEDGWWNPIESLLDQANGRSLLLGYDRQALRSEVDQRDQPAVSELLAQGKLSKLLRLLEERRSNLHLRSQVYRYLAASGRAEDLVQLAQGFAMADEPAGEDLRAWLAGRFGLAPEGKDLDRLIDDLRAAIARQPDLAALYLLLGSAYERTSAADRLELARACYSKASELARWGEIKDTADQAIERIDQAG